MTTGIASVVRQLFRRQRRADADLMQNDGRESRVLSELRERTAGGERILRELRNETAENACFGRRRERNFDNSVYYLESFYSEEDYDHDPRPVLEETLAVLRDYLGI